MKLFAVVLVFLLSIVTTSAFAADSLDCNASLQTTKIYRSSNLNAQLALLSLIDKSNYQKAKQNIDTTAVFDGGLFKGDYDQFKKSLSTYESQYQMNFSEASNQVYATEYLPGDVLNSWTACKKLEATSQVGFHAFVEKASPKLITVYFQWVSVPGDTKSYQTTMYEVIGAQNGYDALPKSWVSGQSAYIVYRRKSASTEFVVDATVGNIGVNIDVPAEIGSGNQKISLSCGSFVSGAIEAAAQPGQAARRNGPDGTPLSVPFASTRLATNSGQTGAATVFSASCNGTSPTSSQGAENIVFSSQAYRSGPNGTGWAAWARWAPTWNMKMVLPRNGKSTQYKLSLNFSDKNDNPTALPACPIKITGASGVVADSIASNGTGNINPSINPGEYLVEFDCSRAEVETFNETISLNISAQRLTSNAPTKSTAQK